MYATLESRSKMAYVGFEDPDTDVRVAQSVRPDQWADEAGVDAMQSLTLDFDERGRLVGIEVWDAKRVLPHALIDRARRI
jgi:uncharacterized protein YuzE